jgi:hypothetical protein
MKKLEGRKRYDSPPEGYRRYTIYMASDVYEAMRQQTEKEQISIKAFIEQAILRRIKYATYNPVR